MKIRIIIANEAAKPIKTARQEAQRAVGTFRFAAAEARTLAGDVVPLDALHRPAQDRDHLVEGQPAADRQHEDDAGEDEHGGHDREQGLIRRQVDVAVALLAGEQREPHDDPPKSTSPPEA